MCLPNSYNDRTAALVRRIIENVEETTGLHVAQNGAWLELHRDDCRTVALVELTGDTVGDLDRLRECWTSSVHLGSNLSFD